MAGNLTASMASLLQNDLYATERTGIRLLQVTLDEDGRSASAQCDLTLNDSHRNARGQVMGGVLCTLADFAFSAACNAPDVAEGKGLHWVTLDSTMHYLSPTSGDTLHAKTRCHRQGRTVALHTIDIIDGTGHVVAQATTTGMRCN